MMSGRLAADQIRPIGRDRDTQDAAPLDLAGAHPTDRRMPRGVNDQNPHVARGFQQRAIGFTARQLRDIVAESFAEAAGS